MAMTDWPEFPEKMPEPPADYFDTLAARAVSRYRQRRAQRRKLIMGLASTLIFCCIIIFLLFVPYRSSQPLQETHFSKEKPSETDILLTLSAAENHRTDSPVSGSRPEISYPKAAPTGADTSLTHEDILDFLLDENYLDV